MNKQLIAIFCTIFSCAFVVGACVEDKQTVQAVKDLVASKDLRVAVLKDYGTLVVPSDGTEYDLKPFLASLHGVEKTKIRMSQSEANVEFDTDDCPEDATETHELEYQVNAKDYTLDIECADSAEDLPAKVTEGLLALADDKIYMYELDDNDASGDKVAITLGEMLFFIPESQDLNLTKKLSKQAVRFEDDDDDTESEDVGAVLAFGATGGIKVKAPDGGGGEAKGNGYLFIAVHWGEDNDADEAFGLGENETDNITKLVSGNNDDDDDNDGDDSDDDNDDNDDDNTPSEVCGEKDAGSSASAGDACSCTKSGATKKGVVNAAGKCAFSTAVCGQKPQSGTDDTSCTCKVNVADATTSAGVIASDICVVSNLCGTKTHTADNNAACTCKAAAGDAQEGAGLVVSNVCYDKAPVCGHKDQTADNGAACTCKEEADDASTIPGVVAANKCIVGACGTKGQTADDGTACRCTNTSNAVVAGTIDDNVCHSAATLAAAAPDLAAPFASAEVQVSDTSGSLVFKWECNAAAADSMYHLAADDGELDSCDEVSVESSPKADRTLAGVHILKKGTTAGADWVKAGYIAAASVTKSGDKFTYTLTGVGTGVEYIYAVAPAKGADDLEWKTHLAEATPSSTGTAAIINVASCSGSEEANKKFAVNASTKSITLCVMREEQCGYKAASGDNGADCQCKSGATVAEASSGLVFNNKCLQAGAFSVRRATKHVIDRRITGGNTAWGSLREGTSAPTYKYKPGYFDIVWEPGQGQSGVFALGQERLEVCKKTGTNADTPPTGVTGATWCTGTNETGPNLSTSGQLESAEDVRYYYRVRIQLAGSQEGDEGFWKSKWFYDPAPHTRPWGFSYGADSIMSDAAVTKLLYGGRGNDYLFDKNNAATELTYLIDAFSWDRLGGLEKRHSLEGKTTKIKCEDSSKTLKMVVLTTDSFGASSADDKVAPSACSTSGSLDTKCKSVQITIGSGGALTEIDGTGSNAVSGSPDKHLFFKCE